MKVHGRLGENGTDRNAGALVAAVCVAGPALVALVPMAAAPALVAMARHFGQSADDELFSQIVMTLPAAMLILAAPMAGMLANRIGQRTVLLASLVLYVIGGAGVLLVATQTGLLALRLLLGVAGGGLLTSSLGLIGDHFSGHRREKVLGWATSFSSLLAALALVGGGWLVDRGGWQAPFALYLLGIPTLAVATFAIRNTPPHEEPSAERGTLAGVARVWPYYALLILLTLGMFTPAIQAGFLLSSRGFGSAQTIGTVIAATSVVAMVTAWAFGPLRRRIGLHGFLAIDAASMGLGILVIAVAGSTWQVLAGCCLVGIGAGMSEPATASIIFRKAPPHVHALAMGLIVSALNAGQFLNPLAFDVLRRSGGLTGAFVTFGMLLLGAAMLVAVLRRDDLLERTIKP
ncbi:major facilitator superfamily MFS_1 (plasmid) [Novosphingobium aromaticivorans DSM 12444]|uniref:Major facilitator superfamily MFS_1 n=1 Tax=Novosphingobium aromaticivorans (strain ATCC 700278 / DSM 12444 / CCUG 56034 / CIP 105152 / NBRC 16084 / F199) TaxID=279238 RepID=A4XF87_NOVAD|nr:major facilitator superfamily MFS_1 [Novosphingobium aromaticivorans DSM 12444]